MKRLMALLAAGCLMAMPAWGDSPKDLTDGAACAFRVVTPGRQGPWRPTVAAALQADGVTQPKVSWPGRWRTFVAWEPTEQTRRSAAPAKQDEVPTTLRLGGISASRATLPLYTGGVLDLTVGHGAPGRGRWAWCFGSLKAERDEQFTLVAETAGPVKIWIDGRAVLEAEKGGDHTAAVQVTKGRHVVSARVESGPDRWFLRGAIHPGAGRTVIQGRCTFRAEAPGAFLSLTVSGPGCESAKLNGQALPEPLEELIYRQLPGLSPSLLQRGENVLTWSLPLAEATGPARAKDASPARLEVLGLGPRDVKLTMGPVVSVGKSGALQIAVASNVHAPAVLSIDGRSILSPPGVYHRFGVEDLKPSTQYDYTVSFAGQVQPGRYQLRTPPKPSEPITVAIVGDPQSGKAWKAVSAALVQQRPDLVIIAGDLVVDGLLVEQWQETFLSPAADLLASVPFRVIPGNHDRYSPLMEQLFGYGQTGPHWVQPAGGALLVGIDGGEDFSPEGQARQWVDRVLTATDKDLAFVVSHYPAYSSRNHGKLADDGRVLEWTSRAARNYLVPLLDRHEVDALFGGHDHGYERSELPGGLSAIVTGGAGAGTYPKREDAEKQNPYSKVFAQKHHLSLLRIGKDSATLRVITPEGKQIDMRTWSATQATER
jgi:hypothetical protein